MEAVNISETSVIFYETAWRNIPPGILCTRHRKSLKPFQVMVVLGGLVVIVLAIGPKVRWFKLGQG
jgi:hypothetical protein